MTLQLYVTLCLFVTLRFLYIVTLIHIYILDVTTYILDLYLDIRWTHVPWSHPFHLWIIRDMCYVLNDVISKYDIRRGVCCHMCRALGSPSYLEEHL